MNDRARVPFALVGVLLLVSSAALAATTAPHVAPTDPATERSVERVTAASNTALRSAVRTAARRAASAPVVSAANTTAGRALNDSRPFRDALRLRIYLAARERLALLDARVGDVHASASLPPVAPSDLRRAIERVHLTAVNGSALRVRVGNVTVTARRGDEVVERSVRTRRLLVRTPVLSLHRRVERFERRLNAGPLSPGLGRQLTGQLYPLAWTRGYAQYGGAPIANVLANRHVALTTNRGLVALQRDAFDRADPAARRALAAAGRRVAVHDLVAGATQATRSSRARAVLAAATEAGNVTEPRRPSAAAPSPETPLVVGVNRSATVAYAALVRPSGNRSALVRDAYAAEARLVTEVERRSVERRGDASLPGWSLVDERTTTEAQVAPTAGVAPSPSTNWTVLRATARRVVQSRTTVRRWRRGNRTRTTSASRTATYRVSIAVVGRPAPSRAPVRGVSTAFERGAGPLDGPNLADVADRAVSRLVESRGGPDGVARKAVSGDLDARSVRLVGRRPSALDGWIGRDLAALHERVRNVSVALPRGEVGTYEANPPAALAAALRERRARLVDAPETYGSVADRARIAVRAAYVDRVLAALERRTDARRGRRDRFAGALRDAGAGSLSRLRRLVDTPSTGRPRDRPLSLSVDGTPAYLTLASVERGRADRGVYPLAARNVNVFTSPHGDAADSVVAALRPRRVDLATAARTLRAASRIEENRTLRRRRATLERAVTRSVGRTRGALRDVLARHGVGRSTAERRELLDDALARWSTPADRALALTNGSAVPAIVEVAARRSPDAVGTPLARDRLTGRLRTALGRARRTVRPPQRPVERTANATRAAATAALREGVAQGAASVSDATRARLGETLGAIPSGLPVAPVPGYWYATTNVWHVSVRGRYEEFAVRTRLGPPGARLSYVRDGGAVRLDVDADGDRELLGQADRVAFETETTVLVVVPPNGRGVGDTDGQMVETSPGWEHTRGPGASRRAAHSSRGSTADATAGN